MVGLEEVMRRKDGIWLAVLAAATLLWCGCSGVIAEKEEKNGETETLRLSTPDKWSSYDRNATKDNDSCLMLKKESTF
jgi:hypothetical protein